MVHLGLQLFLDVLIKMKTTFRKFDSLKRSEKKDYVDANEFSFEDQDSVGRDDATSTTRSVSEL